VTAPDQGTPNASSALPVSVIIPALNEAGNLPALVAATLSQRVAEVIVVDNGSTDATATVAAAAGARVLREPRRGYGYACAAGSAAAAHPILVYLDADHSFLPAELPRLVEPILADRADLVLGSRPLGGIAPRAMPPHQRFGNWLTAALMRRIYGLPVTDLGPYRAIRAPLLASLDMREMTYGWPTEMMVKAAGRAARVAEVPVSYHARRAGRSKIGGTLKGSALAAYHILRVTLQNHT
jgi:glycosyltransferase involved in cell wall biosynthesis